MTAFRRLQVALVGCGAVSRLYYMPALQELARYDLHFAPFRLLLRVQDYSHIAAVRTELNQALHRQQKALDDFAFLIAADEEQKELFASIQTKNNEYRKTIADVLDLAEMDSETAILYAVDAEVGIAALRKGIDGFFNSNEEALDGYFDDITASAKESLLILVVLTAAALDKMHRGVRTKSRRRSTHSRGAGGT